MRFRRAVPVDPSTPAKPPRSMRARMIIAALSGAASVFAFAPFGYWPVQIVALALLFYQVLRGGGVKRAALIGWAYGTGLVAAGVHWLYVSLHYYGAMAAPLAALAVLLLAFGMGAYGALAMAGAAWLRQRWTLSLPLTNLLVLPVAWGLSELVRGWLFTGFSWLSSGYAHNTSPLAGFAPLLGVYGLGWLAALCAGALLLLVHRSRKLAVGVLVVVMGAGFLFGRVSWTHAEGQPVSVRLLQGNVPQQEKFDPGFVLAALNMYRDAITAQGADLIATPETALAVLPQQLPPEYLPALTAFAQQSHSHLLLGIPTSDGPDQYANSAVGVAPAGQANALEQGYRYDKHHLVPFGEFIPLGFRWFTNLMSIPLGDMTRGATVQAAFPVKDQLILPNICYEDLFGEEIAEQLRSPVGGQKPATILLNISNLAWFGNTIAIPQHLQISQMRSLETGRPMLRSTNTGATAVIGADGEVKGMLAPNTRATLSAKVQGMAGDTPYILFGNKLFLALAALSLAAARLLSTRKAKREAPLAAPEKQV